MTLSNRKILIIDANLKVQQILKDYFEEEGFSVISSCSGRKSIAIAKKELPDVIIIDILTPDMDGIEILKVMGEDESLEKIPKIVLTNVDEREKREKSRIMGAVKYLQKSSQKLKDIKRQVEIVLLGSEKVQKKQKEQKEKEKSLIAMMNDDNFLLQIFERLFREEGYEFRGINSVPPYGVINLMKESKRPALVIVDLVMCADGIKVIEELERDKDYRKIPIVVLDNVYLEEEVKRAKTIGADLFISMRDNTPKQAMEKMIQYLNEDTSFFLNES